MASQQKAVLLSQRKLLPPITGHNSCQYAYNSMYMDRIKTSQPAIVDAAVLHNEQVAPRYHLLSLRLDVSSGETSWLQGVAPGQFVQVDCRPAGILLRRPISIYKWSREELCLMLLVQRVGRGSNYMCDLKVGDRVNIVGPLGTPFATDPTIAGERPNRWRGGDGSRHHASSSSAAAINGSTSPDHRRSYRFLANTAR